MKKRRFMRRLSYRPVNGDRRGHLHGHDRHRVHARHCSNDPPSPGSGKAGNRPLALTGNSEAPAGNNAVPSSNAVPERSNAATGSNHGDIDTP